MAYKKSYYKRRYKKRSYKKKRYNRRWKRHYYKKYIRKAPEIHRSKIDYYFNNTTGDITADGITYLKNGSMVSLTNFTKNEFNQLLLNGVPVDGRKVNLKYIYIKGYKDIGDANNDNETDQENNFYGRMAVYCQRLNTSNGSLSYTQLYNGNLFNLDNTTWTEKNIRDILYKADYRDDTFRSIRKYHKKFYNKYDDANNTLPIKKRIVLNKVIECDDEATSNSTDPQRIPTRNALWLSDITKPGVSNSNWTHIYTHLTVSLYWTDY